MRYYLVDYENVRSHGIDAINKLSAQDHVKIFFSANSNNIPISLHRKIVISPAKVEFIGVESGTKNALDFQLATYLGFLIAENKAVDIEVYIVSKDKGFSCLVSYWEKRDIRVHQVLDISGKEEKAELKRIEQEVEKLGFNPSMAVQIARIIQELKTKQGIHSRLLKEFQSKDNKVGSEIYKKIKPLISDKKGQ